MSPSSPVKNGIDENIRELTSPPLTSSTPARPQQIALNPGQLNSPDSDYSMDSQYNALYLHELVNEIRRIL